MSTNDPRAKLFDPCAVQLGPLNPEHPNYEAQKAACPPQPTDEWEVLAGRVLRVKPAVFLDAAEQDVLRKTLLKTAAPGGLPEATSILSSAGKAASSRGERSPAPAAAPTPRTEAPYCRAAFINAIADEGTKEEAVGWLQRIWNERCQLENVIASAHDSAHDELCRLGARLYEMRDRAVRAEAALRQIIKGVDDPQFTAAEYLGGYDKMEKL